MKRIVKTYQIDLDQYVQYEVESQDYYIRNSEATWGEQYDPIEKKIVKGGIPLVLQKVNND